MYIRTETGSIYHFDREAETLTRMESTHKMLRDGEPIKVLGLFHRLEVGVRPMFLLEGVGFLPMTERQLSEIQQISDTYEGVLDEGPNS